MPPASGTLSGSAGILGLAVESGGGARLVRISCLCSSMASTISTLVRGLICYCRATVVDLSHCMNIITCWVIPIASAFTFIMCHVLVGDRNGADISGCTRERGDIGTRGNATLSGLGVFHGNLGIQGVRRDNSTSMSSSCDTSTSLCSSHSGSTMTEAGSWLSWMYLAKVMTFLSSDVGLVKDGVTNWVTKSILMCGSGDSRHTSTAGLSPNGKVTILSNLVWEGVYCFSSRREKMAGRPASARPGAVSTTPAMVSLISEIFCGGWRAWGRVWGRGGVCISWRPVWLC